jgi:tetratricopeptide (TPR) repeat protein
MRVLFLTIVLLIQSIGNAQKIDCSKQIKEYQEFLLVKNFVDAKSPWEFVAKNCPKQSADIYTDGIQIHQYVIDYASSTEDKEKAVRELMKVYDQFHKNFPDNSQDFEIKKALLLLDNAIDSKDEIYTLFENGFAKASDKVKDGNTIFSYFKMFNEKYKSGDKKITLDKYIEKYSQLNQLLISLKISNPNQIEEYNITQKSLSATAKDNFNCENLSEYFGKNLTVNAENQEWLETGLEMLKAKCSNKPIFLTLAEKNYNLKKTAKSADYLALASLKNRKFDDAKKYYEESADLEVNSTEKAQKYYYIGTNLYNNNVPKIKEFLKKSIAIEPRNTKAYVFLAETYANSAERCGKNDFEKKAIYYLAIQTANKAVVNDPKSAKTIERSVANYTTKALSKDEISKGKWFGKNYTIECDINETIEFSSKK